MGFKLTAGIVEYLCLHRDHSAGFIFDADAEGLVVSIDEQRSNCSTRIATDEHAGLIAKPIVRMVGGNQSSTICPDRFLEELVGSIQWFRIDVVVQQTPGNARMEIIEDRVVCAIEPSRRASWSISAQCSQPASAFPSACDVPVP